MKSCHSLCDCDIIGSTAPMQRLEPLTMPEACDLSGGSRSPPAVPAGRICFRWQTVPGQDPLLGVFSFAAVQPRPFSIVPNCHNL